MRSRQDRRPARPYGFDIRGTVVDTAAAVVLAYLAVSAALDPPGPAFTGPVWVAWLAGAAVGLPLAVRRRWPLPVLGWVVVAAATATALGAVGTGVIWATYAPVALALYTVATAAGPVVAAVALAGSLAAPAATIPWLYHRFGITPADAPNSEAPLWWQVELGVVAVAVTAAWATGRVVRWRRTVRADLARQLARDAVAAERLRIARELHDIVGHSMSLIAVKATVANHIAAARPAETRAALVTIERTSRAALTEIRRLLDVLRSDTDPAAADRPSSSNIGVLLADDHALMRESFRALLDASPGFTAVGEAGTGTEAVRLAWQHLPDVVLMDVRMPDMDGIEATRQICAGPATASVRVLILTTFDLDEYVYAALQAGASGFLVKDTTAADLLAGIRVVASGEALLAPR